MRRSIRFLKNALILCATSITLRLIGIGFNAYMVERIGAAGMGLFQLVSSVYFLAVTFACSGIHMATTRLIAEELARNSPRGLRAVMSRCLLYSITFGGTAFFLLYFGAEALGADWLGDGRTVASIRILAIGLPFVAMSSVLRGYFTAVRRVSKTSLVDITEQLLQMGLIVFLLTCLLPSGLESACIAMALGGTISELGACLMLGLAHLADRKRYSVRPGEEAPRRMLPRILKISLPVAFSAYLRSGLSSMNQLLIPASLQRHGLDEENALARYGMVQSMVMPVLQLPEMFLSSFSSLLIPEFTDFYIKKDQRSIARTMTLVFRATFLFAIGALGFFLCFARDISQMLYRDDTVGFYLAILSPMVILMYLDRVVDCTLTGLHQQVNSMLYNLIESMVTSVLTLVLIPRLGMAGYVLVLFVGKAINMGMSLARLIKVTDFHIAFWQWVGYPVLAMMVGVAAIAVIRSWILPPWILLGAVFLGIYILQLGLMGCFGQKAPAIFSQLHRPWTGAASNSEAKERP